MSRLTDVRRINARVAVLTSRSRGAVAVLGVWGPDALKGADAVFRPANQPGLARTRSGRPRLGRVGAGLGDEVVAIVLEPEEGGATATHPVVEFQCHGGTAAVELVLSALTAAGVSRTEPLDWIRDRAGSSLRAAAWSDLPRAPTIRAAEILLEQAEGAFDRELERIIESLSADSAAADAETAGLLAGLLDRGRFGVRLIRGWRIALAGAPNVGKSSLANALAGYRRSIIDAAPGTTRDVVTTSLSIGGWPVELADTAGIRIATEELERIGVERARRAHEEADLVIPVLDRSQPLGTADVELIHRFRESPIVANKSDLPAAWRPGDLGNAENRYLEASALNPSGVDALVSALERLVAPDPPPAGSAVPWRSGQVHLLRRAEQAAARGDRAAAAAALIRLLISNEID